MKKCWLLLVMAIAALQVYGGVYRHDVSPEKYKKLAREKQFDCVGMVLTNCGVDYHGDCKFRGSCVLIGKKYVLTAAHCITHVDIRLDTFYLDQNRKRVDSPVKGGAMLILNQPVATCSDTTANFSFRFKDRLYYAVKWQIYKPYLDSVNAKPGVNFCGDLALVELTDTVEGVIPANLNVAFDEQGAIITGVGYGISGAANRVDDLGPFCEKIAGQNMADSIEGYKVKGIPSLLSYDFDSPTDTGYNHMGSAKPLPLEWSPAAGDSGGGVFRNYHGHWQLVGIIVGGPHSGYNSESDRKNCYGGIASCERISVFNDWIRETMSGFDVADMQAVH